MCLFFLWNPAFIVANRSWHSRLDLISKALLALLKDGITNTLGLRKRHHMIHVLATDDEDVGNAGGESTALGILHVHNLEGTNVLLSVSDHTNTTLVLTTSNDASSTALELDHVSGFVGFNVHLHNVMELGIGIRVADGAALVGGDVRDTLGANSHTQHTAQLVCVLLGESFVVQTVQDEAALGIIQHAEVLVRLVNGDHIHETTWEVGVCSHLAIDLHEALHENLLHLLLGQRILEAIAQDKDKRQALAELVRTSGRARSPGPSHLVQHPV